MPSAKGRKAGRRGAGRKPSRPQLTREEIWLRYWTAARVKLGLNDQEFLSYTPRQLDSLRRAQERREQETEFLFGQLSAIVANFSHRAPKEPARAADFMPSEIRRRRDFAAKPLTDEQHQSIADKIRSRMAAFLKVS